MIVLSCLMVVFVIADRLSYQKYNGETGGGTSLGFAMDLKGLILFIALLALAIVLFIRGRKLLSRAR